jgi:1,4-dihydroxy-6-naphthoate synthase
MTLPVRPPLTLGISPCPNDIYIFAGILLGRVDLGQRRFDVVFEDVEALNARARAGALDVVKISYANYRHVAAQYELLPSGGALGRGVGPLLLSHGNVALDRDAELLVPGEFTTANFLLDFYTGEGLKKRFLAFDRLYEELRERPGAQGVVIHEKRFTYVRDGLALIQDLGEYWESRTGYPIPLGAIIARRDLDAATELDALVRESLAWSDAHPRDAFALCREYADDLDDAVIQAHIDLYVNEYSRELGDDGREAIQFFFAEQRKRGGVAV